MLRVMAPTHEAPPGPAHVGDVPPVMRAAVITRHGGPDVIELRDVPVPRPGPTEVLVRVSAAGCNNTDLWTREGSYGESNGSGQKAGWLGPLDFPRIQGGDVAGVVVACGDAVETDVVGARVLVDPALYEDSTQDARPVDVLGSERDGGFAEYVVVPAERVHDVGESPLTDVELAALPIAYGTALGMLERGSVGDGHTVLVTGASGGVGLAVVQLARARGARVVAVCSGDKAEGVRTAGAAVVVDRRRGQVVADAAEAAPAGYDAVIDVVAGPLVGQGLGLLSAGRSLGRGRRPGRLVRRAGRTASVPGQPGAGGFDHAHAACLRPPRGPGTTGPRPAGDRRDLRAGGRRRGATTAGPT